MPKLLLGDCLEKLKEIDSNSVDAIVTDPPYELGFMGKKWDSTGIANNVEMWGECLRVLKPGGYLLSFSGTRTYHRMASAIEDAGFEIRDMIEWVYGSGFPKSLNIGKAVDKLQGNEREFVCENPANRPYNLTKGETSTGWKSPPRPDKDKGNSEWEGWGTALKPAHEPICMARKPLAEKTVAENCLKWATGGINIDESRVGTEEMGGGTMPDLRDVGAMSKETIGIDKQSFGQNYRPAKRKEQPTYTGRFPANLLHDNSEEVRECFPNESERYFKSIIYQAKASKKERNRGCEGLPLGEPPAKNNHPTVKPVALMEYLIKMISIENATILDPFMGSGTTGVACKKLNRQFVGIEKEVEYIEIAKKRINSTIQTKLL